MGTSIRVAHQRAWLHTPCLLLVILVSGSICVHLTQLEHAAQREASDRLAQESYARHWSGSEWYSALDRKMSQYPFYVRHGEDIGALCYAAAAIFWPWSLLRFIGTPRRPTPSTRMPTCENCGYILMGLPLEGRCPECGEPILLSLGPEVRAVTPWLLHRPQGRLFALLQCLSEAICSPRRFGRRLSSSPQQPDHRWVFAAVLFALFVIGWLCTTAADVAAAGARGGNGYYSVRWARGPLVGLLVTLPAIPIALLTAGLVGLVYRARYGRSYHSGTMQAACYSAAYFVPWSLLALLVLVSGELGSLNPGRNGMELAGLLVPNFLGLAGYFLLVARITSGMKYANR